MYLTFALVLVGTAAFGSVESVDARHPGPKFGVQMGLVFANIEPVEHTNYDFAHVTTGRAGAVALFRPASRISWQTGLALEGQGAELERSGRLFLTYLTLPVAIRYAPFNTRARPFASLAFEFKGLLAASEHNARTEQTQNAKNAFHDGDAGLAAGFGCAIPLRGILTSLEVSYYRGLVDVFKHSSDEGAWPQMENRSWRCTLAVLR
jgi:hypothetical protein